MAAKTVKMCDVSKEIAADVFSKLNKGKIIIDESCGKCAFVRKQNLKILYTRKVGTIQKVLSVTSITQLQEYMKKYQCADILKNRGQNMFLIPHRMLMYKKNFLFAFIRRRFSFIILFSLLLFYVNII